MAGNLIRPGVDGLPIPKVPKTASDDPKQELERCRHLGRGEHTGEKSVAANREVPGQGSCQAFLLQCRAARAKRLWQPVSHADLKAQTGRFPTREHGD